MSKCIIENENRSMTSGYINPDNYTPLPKNPAIAVFFREIHMAEELGSGVRNNLSMASIILILDQF